MNKKTKIGIFDFMEPIFRFTCLQNVKCMADIKAFVPNPEAKHNVVTTGVRG
jgi:hypothetical protein